MRLGACTLVVDVVSVIFIIGDILVVNTLGNFFPDIAQMPWLVGETKDEGFPLGLAQDEAVFMAMFTHPHAFLRLIKWPPHGMLPRCDVDG